VILVEPPNGAKYYAVIDPATCPNGIQPLNTWSPGNNWKAANSKLLEWKVQPVDYTNGYEEVDEDHGGGPYNTLNGYWPSVNWTLFYNNEPKNLSEFSEAWLNLYSIYCVTPDTTQFKMFRSYLSTLLLPIKNGQLLVSGSEDYKAIKLIRDLLCSNPKHPDIINAQYTIPNVNHWIDLLQNDVLKTLKLQ
jgi:hypothetical protein